MTTRLEAEIEFGASAVLALLQSPEALEAMAESERGYILREDADDGDRELHARLQRDALIAYLSEEVS